MRPNPPVPEGIQRDDFSHESRDAAGHDQSHRAGCDIRVMRLTLDAPTLGGGNLMFYFPVSKPEIREVRAMAVPGVLRRW